MFRSIFTGFGKGGVADGALLTLGITFQDYLVAGIALAVVLVIGILHERGVHIRECVAAWPIVPRWCFYFAGAVRGTDLRRLRRWPYSCGQLIYAGL